MLTMYARSTVRKSISVLVEHLVSRPCLRWSCMRPLSTAYSKNVSFQPMQASEPQRHHLKRSEKKYAAVKSALLRYKEINGDMLVPYAFMIPADDVTWPEDTWGMKLGKTVNRIRGGQSNKDHREDLKSMGFDYSSQRIVYGYAVVRLALLRFKVLHGNMLVPQSFTVPANDFTWPEKTWGLKLGKTVNSIRRGPNYKDHRDDLKSVGFDYSTQKMGYGYAVVTSALLRYKEIHCDMLVPAVFIIPADDVTWPERTWGMKLGATVNSIRGGHTYKDRRQDLESIGFDYSPQRIVYGYASLRSALLRYKEKYGDLIVSCGFIVPADDVTWPEETWGLKLGVTVSQIRGGRDYRDHRQDLESIGFNYNPQRVVYGYASLRSALLRYKEIHGDMLVPYAFIVRADDVTWPEETWGMKLGRSAQRIRSGNIYVKRREELESIGFDYGSED